MKIGLALTGVSFALAAAVLAVGSVGIVFRLLTDGDGQPSEIGFRMLIALVVFGGLSCLATKLSFVCFRSWQRRSNSEITRLF